MNSTHKKWKTLQPAIEAHGRKAIEALYSETGRDIIKKMVEDAKYLSKLGSIDEELYSQCVWLIGAYEEIVTFHENFREDIVNPEIRGITDGIITILFSRMREFEESAPADGSNPIAAEKETIISHAAEHLEKASSIQLQVFFPELWGSLAMARWVKDGMTKETLLALSEATHDRIFPYLYGAYRESLDLCRDRLKDFERRKAVQFYKAMMEDELEILSTIIKVQVQALEQAAKGLLEEDFSEESILEENLPEDDPGELVLHKILSLLREAYQRFGKSSTEILAAFNHSENISSYLSHEQYESEACSYECFEAFLNTCLEKAPYINDTALEDKIHTFKLQVEQEAESLLAQHRLSFFKSLHRFHRIVGGEVALAIEMTDIFIKLREDWPEIILEANVSEAKSEVTEDIEAKCEETEGIEILRGVAETIEIKIDGLQESIEQFQEECVRIIEAFAAENTDPSHEEVKAAKAEIWQLWAQNPDDFAPNPTGILTLMELHKHLDKSISRHQEVLNKKLHRFKCESLLYEISTYEEIIFYSVSRLRKLESKMFQQGAVLADAALNHLEVLLKKNKIEIIRPQPHDPFNSKEHEVLMAESAPDFKKGEIVKLMTSGYRQNDVVLLRANVIAAR